ncbi:hypothetical protein [Halobacillus naozhouensis]|uniref:Uncharacterized protein n=1 Tax=Halobacillus naozhouensis TaxID=554880 RepID=A0ABY8IWF5_9BACI|nr:hypothetical protein [Halobacillus naozhouensis]WFT74548.1 hypothetical protein P9989_19695 [Halobacillus naozhouensis]
MFKKLGIVLLMAGISLIIYAGESLYQSSMTQSNALKEAKLLVNKLPNKVTESPSLAKELSEFKWWMERTPIK